MHYATMFLGSLALLFNAAVARAQNPLSAASRDAQHLAKCTADKRISNTRAFLIALSVDQGETWTFVHAEGMTAGEDPLHPPELRRSTSTSHDLDRFVRGASFS